jgi:hypothetical protein
MATHAEVRLKASGELHYIVIYTYQSLFSIIKSVVSDAYNDIIIMCTFAYY